MGDLVVCVVDDWYLHVWPSRHIATHQCCPMRGRGCRGMPAYGVSACEYGLRKDAVRMAFEIITRQM